MEVESQETKAMGKAKCTAKEDQMDTDGSVTQSPALMTRKSLADELPDSVCEECEDNPSALVCELCEGYFCSLCFQILHRKGKRAGHEPKPFTIPAAAAAAAGGGGGGQAGASPGTAPGVAPPPSSSSLEEVTSPPATARDAVLAAAGGVGLNPDLSQYAKMRERAKYIPLRLSYEERRFLRLLQATLTVCDYTTRVDAHDFKAEAQRQHLQMSKLCHLLTGMVTSLSYRRGQELARSRDFQGYEELFQDAFEIGRRHKIMNPEKMRGEYGKMIYLLQDAQKNSEDLQFSCKRPVLTVYSLLEDAKAAKMLDDPNIELATEEILPDPNVSRAEIQQRIKRKNRLVEAFAKTYASRRISAEDVRLCLYSICDNKSFLNSNRLPIDKMIGYLRKYFRPDQWEEGYCLAISSGEGGARLTHSHERQYNFVLQSLYLWREIVNDMFRLWYLAEEDLLSDTESYRLEDTGQGRQRVQNSPRTFKAMQEILYCTQVKLGSWVGSSVIHLGDRNVPNALTFIDKYAQVARILLPIVNTLELVEKICKEDSGISYYIEHGFGGLGKLRKDILFDFFQKAFDGSGADNFFDAGSCIDGRLTSAWNWCAQLSQKPFYPIFKLTGFTGFDGEFK
uniref:B box-type domain-containing protein n=1 Tax=Fibrocapsa japonica TaxID=94617 RepID=A0A7S2V695_9STRA